MNRSIALVVALVLVLGAAASVQASIFSDALSIDGKPDIIRDNSVSLALFDNNNDGIVNQGDAIGGLLKWNDNITTKQNFQPTALTFFVAEILTGPTATNPIQGNSALRFTLGPVTTDPNSTAAKLLPLQSAAAGGFAANTIGATFSAPNGTNLTNVSLASALTALDNTSTWTLDFTFGKTLTSDFFVADLVDFDGSGQITFNEYASFASQDLIGYEAGAFSKIISNIGEFVPVTANDLNGQPMSGQILLLPSTTLAQPTQEQLDNGYMFSDQATAKMNVIPEPASLLVWGGFLAAACLAFWRRKAA